MDDLIKYLIEILFIFSDFCYKYFTTGKISNQNCIKNFHYCNISLFVSILLIRNFSDFQSQLITSYNNGKYTRRIWRVGGRDSSSSWSNDNWAIRCSISSSKILCTRDSLSNIIFNNSLTTFSYICWKAIINLPICCLVSL